MSITRNLKCVSFLISSVLVVPLIVQLLIISQSSYLIDCLSLTELHSTLPSNNNNNNNKNNQFKSRLSKDKSIRDAIRNLNPHRQRLTNRDSIIDTYYPQQSTNNNNYDLIVDDLNGGNSFNQQYLTDLPVVIDDNNDDSQANLPKYLIVKSPTINGINKRQDEVVMDIPLEYTADIPYEFYPELWPSNQQKSPSFQGKVDGDDLSTSDVLSQVLAAKIAKLLASESSGHSNPKRKRVLVKRNHRSGLLGSPSNGGNHHRSNRVSPNLSTNPNLRMINNAKSMIGDSKHHSLDHESVKDKKMSKVTSRKIGETKKVQTKLHRVPLKSTVTGHQSVKGDFAKLVNGKAIHVPALAIHSKVINATALGHKEFMKSQKKPLISKNFRKIETIHRNTPLNLNRKSVKAITRPSAYQGSMKEFFNEIDLPKGPKNIVKRSISSQPAVDLVDIGLRREEDAIDGDDDTDDGDDSVDGNNNIRRGEDDIESEVDEGEFKPTIGQLASSSPIILQSNPWLVDEATRTLMRSLTVKRRKRGNLNNDDQLTVIGLDDGDVTASTATTIMTSADDNNEDEDATDNKVNNNMNDQVRINGIDVPKSSGKPILTDLIDLDDFDEIPARIVKKDGVTLREGHADIDEDENINLKISNHKKSEKELNTNVSQLKPTAITSLLSGGGEPDGDNETFFEEELSEGLISIGDLDDLDKINKSTTINSLINGENDDKEKNIKPMELSSTTTPFPMTSGDEVRIDGKLLLEGVDDQIVNGSVDPEDQMLVETINKGLYVNNKRKRSVNSTPYFGKLGESSSSALIAQETAKFNDVDEKLERIEETLILEALDLIKSNLKNDENGQLSTGDQNVEHRIESRLNAAYDLEDMRLALTDLHKIMQQMSIEDEEEVDDIDKNEHGNEINDLPVGREIYLDSTGKVSFSGKLDGDDDEEQDIKGDNGQLAISPSTLSSFTNYRDSIVTKNHHLNQINIDECPAIRTLTTDCSAVKDVVPYGSLQKIFGQACNWHEVCYSCGELFGLLSSDCDMGFLEQSRLACNDSASCETASRLILMPLKSRRIFYKQKVPSVCYQQPCIESFLLKSRRKR